MRFQSNAKNPRRQSSRRITFRHRKFSSLSGNIFPFNGVYNPASVPRRVTSSWKQKILEFFQLLRRIPQFFRTREFLRAELLTFQDRDDFLDILDSLDSLDSGNFLLLVDNLFLWYFSHIETKRTLKVIHIVPVDLLEPINANSAPSFVNFLVI